MSDKPPRSGLKALDPDDLFAIFDSLPTDGAAPAPKDTAENVKGHTHRKTRSLVGFDPMLETVQQAKPLTTAAVWSHDAADSSHPFLSSKSTTAISGKPPVGGHRSSKSLCVNDLKDIASQLSHDRPRAMSKEEEFQITLGDSTKDSIPKQDRKLLKKKSHRKSHTVSDVLGLTAALSKLTAPPTTPETHGKAIAKKSVSPATTPPRGATPNGSRANTPIQSPNVMKHTITSKLSPPRPPVKFSISIPTLAKQSPTSFLKDASTMAPRSSEQDPSPHQVAIPSSQELYGEAKLCALLDSYRTMDQNFDFNTLVDVDQLQLKSFCSLGGVTIRGLTPEQKPVVHALLDCEDSISVQGYMTEGQDEEQLEVGIFSTQNRILIVYRGTAEQQLKPGRSKCASVELDPENAVQVYPPFRDAYFALEEKVYKLLDRLMEENPFSEVCFCGHSFGGALATIGAVRFATARPMLRFSCHVFGSPKVGTHDFQQLVNTLPNLKVMRIEYGTHPNTLSPADVGSTKYQHVGHSLVIHASVGTNSKAPSHPVAAYRFDHKKPASTSFLTIRKPDIQAYVRALEPFAENQLSWVELYVGEDVGEGVRGKNNEKRLVV